MARTLLAALSLLMITAMPLSAQEKKAERTAERQELIRALIQTLAMSDEKLPPSARELADEMRRDARAALAAMGAQVAPEIIAALSDKNERIVFVAIQFMGATATVDSRYDSAVPKLTAMLKDAKTPMAIRRAAAEALRIIGPNY